MSQSHDECDAIKDKMYENLRHNYEEPEDKT